MRLILPLFAVLLLAPAASAATLADHEEPHEGLDKVFLFTLTPDEAAKPHAAIFRGTPGKPFGLQIVDAQGKELWIKNGSRGIQTFPTLEPGDYRFVLRGQGAFQVTDKLLDRKDHPVIPYVLNVSPVLGGGTDAYVISPTRNWTLDVGGDVTVEYWDMTGAPETVEAPFNRTARWGSAYVVTVRGEPGTPYSLGFTPTTLPEPTRDSPAPALPLAFAALGLVAVALRRFRRRT